MSKSPSTKLSVGERTRLAILQSALGDFAAHGFKGASIRRIETHAGLTHGQIRYHFESKEKLWLAAVEHLFQRNIAELMPTPAEVAGIETGNIVTIRQWMRRYVLYCARYPEHARIMYQETAVGSDRLKQVIDQYTRSTHHIVLHIINKLMLSGALPASINPVSALYVWVGAAQNFFALAREVELSLNYDPLSPDAIEAHATTVLDLLMPLPKSND